MANGAEYAVKVHATYKDFIPIDFDLTVRYLPNLNGDVKFMDLGTHIFFKDPKGSRPHAAYKFVLANVMNDGLDDDLESYQLALSDGLKYYFELSD